MIGAQSRASTLGNAGPKPHTSAPMDGDLTRWRLRASACAAATALVASLLPPVATAALEFEPCRLERDGLPAAFAECADFAVPEDPAVPDSEPLVLFVARVPSLSATPNPDPLVLVNGGPGGSSVDLYLQGRQAFGPTLRDRDLILLDQRGTGRSVAGLSCETPDELELETATPDQLRAAVAACIAEFRRDPALFTTSIAVRDIELLREALGIDRWNLYGVSYGSRVVQHYLRRYPDSVRTAILDGVVPAELVLGPDIARDAQSALEALFARCAADPQCSERFGDVRVKFAELMQRFADDSIEVMIQDPASGAAQLFDLGQIHLQSVVRLMTYADTTAALLPLVIDEAHQGNYAPLAAQADLLIESVSDSIGFAMHNSVVCTEDVPFFADAGTRANAARDSLAPAVAETAANGAVAAGNADDAGTQPYLGATIVDGLVTICETWPTGLRDEDFSVPVEAANPVLLLSGENDPVTPPAYAERVAAGLSNSVHLVAPGKGHGIAAVGCTPQLIRDFVASAEPGALDADCLADERPMPFFLSFQGPGP